MGAGSLGRAGREPGLPPGQQEVHGGDDLAVDVPAGLAPPGHGGDAKIQISGGEVQLLSDGSL